MTNGFVEAGAATPGSEVQSISDRAAQRRGIFIMGGFLVVDGGRILIWKS